jgi:ribokinase
MPDVLTAGHVNWDVTLRVDALPAADAESLIRSQRSSGGGSAANVAVALADLDVAPGLVGSLGDDQHGLLARRELEAADVDLHGLRRVEGANTAVKYLLVDDDGEVSVLGNDGANEAVTPDDVDDDDVRAADHVHLTSQRPDTAAHLARVASDAGATVSIDPGRRLAERDFSAAVEQADVVFLNEREAEAALDGTNPKDAFPGQVLVLKHGDEGATVTSPGDNHHHPGFDVDPVDTTGAGDAFAAGFIATRHRGGTYADALEYANACGALASQGEGARTAPARDEVSACLDDGT